MKPPIKIGDRDFRRLLYEWNKKLAECPHRPKCRRGKCDVAIPLDKGLSMFEQGGSGGSGEARDISFVSLDAVDAITGEPVAERLMSESASTYGSTSLADTETGSLWRTFSRHVAALPARHPGRKVLEVFADTGCYQTAQDAAGVSRQRTRTIVEKFCREHAIDRRRLVRRKAIE